MPSPSLSLHDLGNGCFRVTIDDTRSTTHEITVPDGYLATLGIPNVAPARVVEASVRFLLERESNTSILPAFPLPVIARYFPEFPHEIASRLRP